MHEKIGIAVFDLDGTLIIQDSLYEQIKSMLQYSIPNLLRSVFLLIVRGRITFKKEVFMINENYDSHYLALNGIKVNENVQKEFYKYKERDIKVIVATASYWRTALKVLYKIRLCPDILISTRNKHNLKGELKLKYLEPYIKNVRWAYYGDSNSDVPLFEEADFPYRVDPYSKKINKLY
tara:strand:- start:251 stop:787 length:537 start_codon:yes stop_codon:yes gene_type:complete